MWRRATGGGGGGGGGAGWPGLVPRCPWVDAKACVVVVVDFTESNATLFSWVIPTLGFGSRRRGRCVDTLRRRCRFSCNLAM